MNSLPEQFAELDARDLPVLSSSTTCLLNYLNGDDLDFVEVANEIEKFPSIAVRLLGVSNSAWAAPVEPISCLLEACKRLGLSVVKSITIAMAISAPFDTKRCQAFDPLQYWCNSLLAADSAVLLANRSQQDLDVQTLRTAGLLHNLGLLWLAHQWPGEITRAYYLAEKNPELHLNSALQQSLGAGYCEAGGFICRSWGLPDHLARAIENHSNHEFRGTDHEISNAICVATRLTAMVLDRKYDTLDWLDDEIFCSYQKDTLEEIVNCLEDRVVPVIELGKAILS